MISKKRLVVGFAIIKILLLLMLVSADTWGIWVRPLSGSSTQPSTAFSYYYVFSNDSACSTVLYQTEAQVIQTDSAGVAFINYTLPTNLTNTKYVCEYRNSSLRASMPTQVQFFNNTFTQNISSQNNVTASWFLGNVNYSSIQNSPSFIIWANAVNGTLMLQSSWNATNTSYILWSNAVNGTLALNSSLATYAYSTNNPSGYIAWSHAINGTLMSQATFNTNYTSTIAKLDATNGFGAFNQTFDTNVLAINANDNRVGIGLVTPQNTFNVLGDGNITGTLYANGSNLSAGYQYVTNGTYYLATNPSAYISWSHAVNGTLATNASTSFYANTLFSANNNLTIGYLYATNNTYLTNATMNKSVYCGSIIGGSDADYCVDSGAGAGISWAEATNGTLAQNNSAAIYADTLFSQGNNVTDGYRYATNGTFMTQSGFNTNYTTTIAKLDTDNTFGNFNQTMNGTTFFLWSLLNRIGIGTTTPQNTLNVVGDVNATTSVFSQNKNLSVGYDYATNGSYVVMWVNKSNTINSSTTADLATNVSNALTAFLLANNTYEFDCKIGYRSNSTTIGIRMAMNATVTPTVISYNTHIITSATAEVNQPNTAAGVASVGTANIATNTNYTAVMYGSVHHTGTNYYMFPTYGIEVVPGIVNVTDASYCKWTKVA